MRIRLLISYDGTDYAGWQRQGPESLDPRPTLQATLENALSKIFNSPIKVQASGRTDAGVHADAQTVHFDIPNNDSGLPIKNPSNMRLIKSLNSLTPDSLCVKMAWFCPDEFHALSSAIHKTYRYVIHHDKTADPVSSRYSWWLERPLETQSLNGLIEVLIGEHDFKSFQTSGTDVKTTVRKILSAKWINHDFKCIFYITGSGFLKQMVRNIVGTTIYLHQNGLGPDEMQRILAAKDRQQAKSTAPANGLFLESVYYPPELDNRCREL